MIRTDIGVVVVTGVGSGLGRALALELARRGRIVAGISRTAEDLQDTVSCSEGPGRIVPFHCDVGNPDNVSATFSGIRKFGPVSVLINNAAVYPHRCILDETTETFMRAVAINLGGMVSCSLCALDDMVRQGRGRILNVSTFADASPLPGSGAYSVSKGAARILTRAMIADICEQYPAIVINDWVPGRLATSMGTADGLDPVIAAKWGAALALSSDPSLTGSVWERDTEVLPPRSFRRRALDKLTLKQTPQPRRLHDPESERELVAMERLSPARWRRVFFPAIGLLYLSGTEL
ncbi:SDR family oxidoreductase [Neorhizobium sp. T786]|uniref:SDR family oxidoreductase n=1 Tax=Pseudorhizobium xiangyangii TaxID=2883104 RepID=UPI001CFFF943|nr:SDR family oxidoreductase [Neorhizobium xiangyangii]MCB5205248.1 SDR family oxidoreductase [Neorhizobium xiangyangii]